MSNTPQLAKLAILGCPNSGKTTLFNRLTGLRATVGNYPGVTVEKIESELTLPDGEQLILADLPGTYGDKPLSDEERVTYAAINGDLDSDYSPDGVIFVADSTTLSRTLPMLGSLLQTDMPVIFVLTMIDELKARGGVVDDIALSHALGVPVVGIVGNRGLGVDDLRALMGKPETFKRRKPLVPIPETALGRFKWSDELITRVVRQPTKGTPVTDRVDSVLLHPIGGVLIFTLVMFAFFQTIFAWAVPLMDLVDLGVGALRKAAANVIPAGFFQSLIVDGIMAGVGSVVIFVPQITLLFLLLAFLRNVGYLARAAFVVDRLMGWFGLDGRCFVALLSSHACAIPGIMATRTIPDPKNRLATILVAPFMACSARLPVYILLVAAFVPATTVFGFASLQAVAMFGLFLIGGLTGLLAALVLRRGFMRGQTLPFYIELPPYRWPSWRTMFSATWRPVWSFLRKVGTVILAASVVLWVLMTFPKIEAPQSVKALGGEAVTAYQLKYSAAGHIGRVIEPLIRPLGFDWKIGVGLLASFAAREVIVSSLAQLYAVADSDDDRSGLIKKLRSEVYPPDHPKAGKPVYTLASALALLMFFVFALQCVSTLAVMKRETGSWKWPAVAYGVMLFLAYVTALVTNYTVPLLL